jgi:hypothetical protein
MTTRRLAAILAADVVGYSKLIGEDEAGTLAALREVRKSIVNPVLAEHGGRVFKLMGDGILAEFPSAVQALRAAIGIQEELSKRNAGPSSGRPIEVRIGVHQGDVVVEGSDLLAPIVCRRVEDSATPEVLRRLNFIFFDDPTHFEASADQLAEALQIDIGWVRKHTEYGEGARHWSAAGRAGGLLLRSPTLEEAERWIASRPHGAPPPTEETQAFVAESRHGASRRRNILTSSLAAGLLVALALAGLGYWQRGIAVEQQRVANEQRQLAEQQRREA